MSPTFVPKEYLPSPEENGSASWVKPAVYCTVDLKNLSSFTLNYSPAPEGYDDSDAAGGRTYFFQPLALRRVDKPHVPRFTTLSWMDASRRRRRKNHRALFVCSHLRPRAYVLSRSLRGSYLEKYLDRRFGLPPAHHQIPSPLSGAPIEAPPTAPIPLQTLSEYMSQASPVPPLQEDDSDSESEPGSEPVSESDPEHDLDGVPYDWARQYRRENPRFHRRWSRYAVTPAINKQSFVFKDKSLKPEERDFEDYLRIGTRTAAEKAADRTSSKYNACEPEITARSLGRVENPLVVRFTDVQPKPNGLDNCYPRVELIACVKELMLSIEGSRGFGVVEVTNTPVTVLGDNRVKDSIFNDGHDGNHGRYTTVYDSCGLSLHVYLSLMSLYTALAIARVDLDSTEACMNGCREVLYSAQGKAVSFMRVLLRTCLMGLAEFVRIVSVLIRFFKMSTQFIMDMMKPKVRSVVSVTGYCIAGWLIGDLYGYICHRFYFWKCNSDLLCCIFVILILVGFRK